MPTQYTFMPYVRASTVPLAPVAFNSAKAMNFKPLRSHA